MSLFRSVCLICACALGGALAQRGAGPKDTPVADLSGKWTFNRVSTGRAGNMRTQLLTMTLTQESNKLTGEASYTTINVQQAGSFPVHGWVEGDQVGISAWVDYQGGEAISMRLTYKDGRLVGSKQSTHDAPHKWNLDDRIDMNYTKATE
jgi:hypothetical protein